MQLSMLIVPFCFEVKLFGIDEKSVLILIILNLFQHSRPKYREVSVSRLPI